LVSDDEKGEHFRDLIFRDSVPHFVHLAKQAVIAGRTTEEFIVLCVDVDDPTWGELINDALPKFDWQKFRDRGERPMARGTVEATTFRKYLKSILPDVGICLDNKPSPDKFHVCVLAMGGATLYFLGFIDFDKPN
jgi:hypothetical protein